MLQLILFSSIYTLVFTGSYVVSGFLNIVYPTNAFISFAIFYSVYAVCCIFAPFIYTKIKLWSLIIAAVSFLILVGFSASLNSTLLYIGHAIGGAGNSIIWLSQGVWISKQDGDQAKLMGIFWGIFNISLILGNLISIIILATSANIQLMLYCMMIPTGLGLILAIIFYIMNRNVEIQQTMNFKESLKDVFLSITYKRYLIIPLMMYSGIGLNITYQVLPILLNRYSIVLGNQTVAIYNACMFLAYGVSAMVSSVMWGILFKKGWQWVMIPYLILELLCLTGIYLLGWFGNANTAGCYILFGIIRGITDFAINNVLNITISTGFSGKTDGGFAFYRLIYAISYMIFSICIGYISIWIIIIISIVFAIISGLCYVLYQVLKPSNIEQEFNNSTIQLN